MVRIKACGTDDETIEKAKGVVIQVAERYQTGCNDRDEFYKLRDSLIEGMVSTSSDSAAFGCTKRVLSNAVFAIALPRGRNSRAALPRAEAGNEG